MGWRRITASGKPSTAPDLIDRDFTAPGLNRKGCGNMTYIKTRDGWAYFITMVGLYLQTMTGCSVVNHVSFRWSRTLFA